jgi:Transglutaminase-like superfamily
MAPVTISADAPGRTAPGAARSVWPARAELVDALALLVLTMIGIVGFRSAYGGTAYLTAGAAGVVLGLLLSYAGLRARLPLVTVAAVGVLAYLLLGGLVGQTGTVSLPVLQSVASAAVSGWQQLLTAARPAGGTGTLLALPYLLGLFSGIAGHALARRTRTVLLPAAAPAVVVALSILFGTVHPVATTAQGAGFAAVALAWAAVRQERGAGRQVIVGSQRPWRRVGARALVLAIAAAGAVFIGPHLPGAGAHKRVVLSAVPPFDVSQYPSPLASFRDYTKDAPLAVSVAAKELLATHGLAPKTLVRIAVMDSYDGLTWGVANTAAATASAGTYGGFQRVGPVLPDAPAGATQTATITVESAYNQPWLPDLAGTSSFRFDSASSSACPAAATASAAADLRYNAATGTAILPDCTLSGLTYTVSYTPTATPSLKALAQDSPGSTPSPATTANMSAAVTSFAGEHAQAETTPLAKVVALAAYLKKYGKYSDSSAQDSENIPGHSIGRLTTFLDSSTRQVVGDDEQYAATMALLANAVGVPAEVSLDAAVEPNDVIKGADVRADVELWTAQSGWVTLPAADFTATNHPTVQQQQVTQSQNPVKVVPPRHNQAAPLTAANQSKSVSRSAATRSSSSWFTIPPVVAAVAEDAGGPVLAVTGLGALLIAAKAVRRRRRRSLGSPAAQVAGAWQELLDLSRDLGIATAAAGTRREFAAYAESRGLPRARPLAVAVDAATFGPAEPDGATVRQVWELAEEARRNATAPLSRRRRLWVAVNPAGLWASRVPAEQVLRRVRRTVLAPAARGV